MIYRTTSQKSDDQGSTSGPGAPNDKILQCVSEHRFNVISVFFVPLKALFLNAKKSVSFRKR